MLRRKVEGHEKTGQDSWPVCLGFVGLLGFSFDVLDSISVAVLHSLYPLIITPSAWVHRVVRLLQAILDAAGNIGANITSRMSRAALSCQSRLRDTGL